MPCCGCLASATPSTCAARLWKTSSSQARRPARPRALPRLSWCSTTPMASCRSTSTRFPSRAACIASGESEYLINGSAGAPHGRARHPARFRSGHRHAFDHRARAAWTPSCNPSPEDRRALIEEAAGVLKHKQRKAKSERKLASHGCARSRACAMWRARWSRQLGAARAQGEEGPRLPRALRAAYRRQLGAGRGRPALPASKLG